MKEIKDLTYCIDMQPMHLSAFQSQYTNFDDALGMNIGFFLLFVYYLKKTQFVINCPFDEKIPLDLLKSVVEEIFLIVNDGKKHTIDAKIEGNSLVIDTSIDDLEWIDLIAKVFGYEGKIKINKIQN